MLSQEERIDRRKLWQVRCVWLTCRAKELALSLSRGESAQSCSVRLLWLQSERQKSERQGDLRENTVSGWI